MFSSTLVITPTEIWSRFMVEASEGEARVTHALLFVSLIAELPYSATLERFVPSTCFFTTEFQLPKNWSFPQIQQD